MFLKIGGDFMQEISKKDYRENFNKMKDTDNYVRFYLLVSTEDKLYLCADIVNEGISRYMETMDFELNTALSIIEADNDCREKYEGNIYFQDYDDDSWEEVTDDFMNIKNDFMHTENYEDEVYLLSDEDELEDILQKYPNKAIYFMSTKDYTS